MLRNMYSKEFFYRETSIAAVLINILLSFLACAGVNTAIKFLWNLCGLPLRDVGGLVLYALMGVATLYFAIGILISVLSHFKIVTFK